MGDDKIFTFELYRSGVKNVNNLAMTPDALEELYELIKPGITMGHLAHVPPQSGRYIPSYLSHVVKDKRKDGDSIIVDIKFFDSRKGREAYRRVRYERRNYSMPYESDIRILSLKPAYIGKLESDRIVGVDGILTCDLIYQERTQERVF